MKWKATPPATAKTRRRQKKTARQTHLLVDHWELRLHLKTTYILVNRSYLFGVVVCVFNPTCVLAHSEINLQTISAKSIRNFIATLIALHITPVSK